jgi:hypothetical protein
MTISQGQFAGYFSRNIKVVDSTGQIHLYMDRPNQTPVYFVMVGGKIRHRGSYKHCREMFNTYSRWYSESHNGKRAKAASA